MGKRPRDCPYITLVFPTSAARLWIIPMLSGIMASAYKSSQTIYQVKHGLLSNYLVQQLKRSDVPMFIA